MTWLHEHGLGALSIALFAILFVLACLGQPVN